MNIDLIFLILLISWFVIGLITTICVVLWIHFYEQEDIPLKYIGVGIAIIIFGYISALLSIVAIWDDIKDITILKRHEKKKIKSLEDELERYKKIVEEMNKTFSKENKV